MPISTCSSRILSTRALTAVKYVRDNPKQALPDAYRGVQAKVRISKPYFESIRKAYLAGDPNLLRRVAEAESAIAKMSADDAPEPKAPTARNETQEHRLVTRILLAQQLLQLSGGDANSAADLLNTVASAAVSK